jgi:hypothetical protein
MLDIRSIRRAVTAIPLVLARLLFVLALSLFTGVAPNLVELATAESEAPFDEDESPENEAMRAEARNDMHRVSSCEPPRLPACCERRFPKTIDTMPASPTGHRFSNGLSAPLRC